MIEARLQTPRVIRRRSVAAHGDGESRPGRAQSPDQVPPGPVRQPDIRKQNVAPRGGDFPQGILHVAGRENDKSLALEVGSETSPRVGVVLHDKDPARPVSPWLWIGHYKKIPIILAGNSNVEASAGGKTFPIAGRPRPRSRRQTPAGRIVGLARTREVGYTFPPARLNPGIPRALSSAVERLLHTRVRVLFPIWPQMR